MTKLRAKWGTNIFEEDIYIEWSGKALQSTLTIREKSGSDDAVWRHSGKPRCSFGFIMGFCYGRIFTTAGESSLLTAHIAENGARWDAMQRDHSDNSHDVVHCDPHLHYSCQIFDYPLHKPLQWWRLPLKPVFVSAYLLFFKSVSQWPTTASTTACEIYCILL